jgi:hypothetical protein
MNGTRPGFAGFGRRIGHLFLAHRICAPSAAPSDCINRSRSGCGGTSARNQIRGRLRPDEKIAAYPAGGSVYYGK